MLLCISIFTGLVQTAIAQNNPKHSLKSYISLCSNCHGTQRDSILADNPIIAGLNKVYLKKQLNDFKSNLRQSKEMNDITQSMSSEIIEALAEHYSAQKYKPYLQPGSKVKGKLMALGEAIFIGKRLDYGIPGCITCHGNDGMGDKTGKYPRLVGQPMNYIINQMKRFRSKERTNDSPPMMQNIAMVMDDEDIESVAVYISSIGKK